MKIWIALAALTLISNSGVFAMETSSKWESPFLRETSYKTSSSEGDIYGQSLHSTEAELCPDPDTFYNVLLGCYEQRLDAFSVRLDWDFDFSQVGDIIYQAHERMATEDDYTANCLLSRRMSSSGRDGDVTVDFSSVEYVSTASQEAQVDERIPTLLDELIMPGMSDEESEKSIHDWIVANVEYDTSYTWHSAYAALFLGKSVCQGYALLTERLLEEAGVHSRIATGTASGDNHAWNMVELLSGEWFHLDCTWDDPVPDVPERILYKYYNLSDSEMDDDHSWVGEKYPSAVDSYSEGICDCQIEEMLEWSPLKPNEIRFYGREGNTYQMQWSFDGSEWHDYGSQHTGAGNLTHIEIDLSENRRLFRIVY